MPWHVSASPCPPKPTFCRIFFVFLSLLAVPLSLPALVYVVLDLVLSGFDSALVGRCFWSVGYSFVAHARRVVCTLGLDLILVQAKRVGCLMRSSYRAFVNPIRAWAGGSLV
eukprot:m.740466 g.740466  ORF g.740466 m.740466 type:complete len:112 (+) comp58927_c0_seq2:1822-2157(+)